MKSPKDFFLLCYILILGLIYSIPSWIISIFITKFINKQITTIIKKKLILIATGILLTVLPIIISWNNPSHWLLNSGETLIAICYSIATVFGIIVFKLKPDDKKIKQISVCL